MKIFIISLITSFCIIPCYSQLPDLNRGKADKKNYIETFPYEMRMGVPIVDVIINQKKFSFMLDTGAMTALSDKVAAELKLLSLDEISVSDSGSNSNAMEVVTVPFLSFGNVSFRDVPAVIVQQAELFQCLGIEGIIGSNLLRNSVIKISSRDQAITITDRPKDLLLDNSHGIDMELSKTQSSPFIWVNFKNGNIEGREILLIDSGMNGFYDLSIEAYDKMFRDMKIFREKYSASGSYAMGIHGSAAIQQQYKVLVPKLEIAGSAFTNVVTNTTTSGASRIGSGLLEYGDVILDYKNRKFYFLPYTKGDINRDDKSWPIELLPNKNSLVVGIVWDTALIGKINPGDQVLKMGEINFENQDICSLMKNKSNLKTDTTLLVVKDVKTGEHKEITITKN